jgi:hypothetical protein
MNKLAMSLVVAAMSVAFAGQSHRITLFQPSIVSGQELRPGDYKLVVENGKAILSQGKNSVEAAVSVESNGSRFSSTSVRYANGDGKYRIREIRIGGTNTKVTFSD